MTTCKGCGAAIVWAETPDGKAQPFDREPNPTGTRVLLGRGPKRAPLVIPARRLEPENADLPKWAEDCFYMPHHATCPKVERFR